MKSTPRKVSKWRSFQLVIIWMLLIVSVFLYLFHGPYADVKVQKLNSVPERLREVKLHKEENSVQNSVPGRTSYVSLLLRSNSSLNDIENKEHDDEGINYDKGDDDYRSSPKSALDLQEQPQRDIFPTDDPTQDIILVGNTDDEVHVIDQDEDIQSENPELRTSPSLRPDDKNIPEVEGTDTVLNVKPVRIGVDYHQNRSTFSTSDIYRMIANLRRASASQNVSSPLKPNNIHWTIMNVGKYKSSLYTPPPNEMPIQRFPKAIIIGVGKCGTRALIEFLEMHPYIVTPRSEIHFFDMDEHFHKGLDWYLSQMPLSFSNQITLEKTPSYIWSDRAMNEIYKLNKNMKLLVIFKDPVVRAVSQTLKVTQDNVDDVLTERRNGVLQVKNETKTILWGHYAAYLKMWFNKFSRSQIYIIESSEFIRNPAAEVQKVEKFLNIPHRITDKNFYLNKTKGFYCMRGFDKPEIKCLGSGKGRPHPQLSPDVEKVLYDHYSKHNEELFQLLGRRYQWQPEENGSNVR